MEHILNQVFSFSESEFMWTEILSSLLLIITSYLLYLKISKQSKEKYLFFSLFTLSFYWLILENDAFFKDGFYFTPVALLHLSSLYFLFNFKKTKEALMHVVVVSLMIMVYFVEVYIEKTNAPILFTTINEEEVLELIIAGLFFIEVLLLSKIKSCFHFPYWTVFPFLLIAFGLSRLNYFDRIPDPNNIRLGSGKFFIF
ncbi:MAG: hypothetical protein KDE33_19080 [Bacteroidetes bacterium]|nr:hypothetical protein [Bacteroidota bacterium]MCB9225551.1 hypothetical protein [Chitinophagales bacterium]